MFTPWVVRKPGRSFASAVGLSLLLTVVGCGSGGDTPPPPAPTPSASGTITGKIVSSAVNNPPVNGATVKTEARTLTTDAEGKFSLPAPSGDRIVVRVEAPGFAEAFAIARVLTGQTTKLGITLVPVGAAAPVSLTADATVSVPNSTARVVIPANSLVPVGGGAPAGSVTVSLTPINPATDPTLMPGDFTGVAAGGGPAQPIENFGVVLLDIRESAGGQYTLAPGKTVTIRIPLGAQAVNPPATIPLWYFDESAGVWREEGTAALQGSGADRYYEGTVARITYWSANRVWDRIVVTGCVKNPAGQAVGGAAVQTKGVDYTGTAIAFTGPDGTFSVAMRKNSQAEVSVVDRDPQTFLSVSLSTIVTVGPSATAIALPDCLVRQPKPVQITTATLPGGRVGRSYNQTLAATGGVPGYVWSLNAGSNALPNGLSLNPTGVLSGTPTAGGTTAITVKVTDAAGETATKLLELTIATIDSPITITNSVFPAVGDTWRFAADHHITPHGTTAPDINQQHWDYSFLKREETWTHVVQDPTAGAHRASFPDATHVIKQNGHPITPFTFPGENGNEAYLKVTGSNVQLLGFAGGSDPLRLGLDLITRYELTDTGVSGLTLPLLRWAPTQMFDILNGGNVGFSIIDLPFSLLAERFPGLLPALQAVDPSLPILGVRLVSSLSSAPRLVDAWGTLTIPGGTFEVLRVRSAMVEQLRLQVLLSLPNIPNPVLAWVDGNYETAASLFLYPGDPGGPDGVLYQKGHSLIGNGWTHDFTLFLDRESKEPLLMLSTAMEYWPPSLGVTKIGGSGVFRTAQFKDLSRPAR